MRHFSYICNTNVKNLIIKVIDTLYVLCLKSTLGVCKVDKT